LAFAASPAEGTSPRGFDPSAKRKAGLGVVLGFCSRRCPGALSETPDQRFSTGCGPGRCSIKRTDMSRREGGQASKTANPAAKSKHAWSVYPTADMYPTGHATMPPAGHATMPPAKPKIPANPG